MKNKKYVNYHCHSSLSNIIVADSPSTIDDYIKRLKELNHTVYVSTEHGISTAWVRKYLECKKQGLKFVFGVEAYLEDSGQVYHLMLMAKNKKGMQSINDCINDAIYNNYKYRRPRITVESIKKFISPQDVVCTTACVAGLIGRKNLPALKELMIFFEENLWLEIGTSNTDKQKELNSIVLKINQARPQHNIVVGLDSHYIYPNEKVLRDSLIASKGIHYDEDEDESEWDLDFPDYDTIVERLTIQGVLSHAQILQSIENTNVIESFEDIEFDTSWHVPTLYPELTIEERDKLLMKKAYEYWLTFSKHVPQELHEKYREEIGKEVKEWIKCGFSDYLLTTSALVKRGVELGGMVTKSGRGCFVPETKVLTVDGYKEIKDVKIGDTVINKCGAFDTVMNVLKYNVNENMTKIHSIGNKDIILTDDHRVYVYDSLKDNFVYKHAKDIKPLTDYLTTPINMSSSTNSVERYDLCKYNTDFFSTDEYIYDHNKGTHNPKEDKLSPKYMKQNKIAGGVTNWKYRNGMLDKESLGYQKMFNYTQMTPEEYKFYVDNTSNTNKIDRYIKNDSELMFLIGFILGDGYIRYEKDNRITLYLQNSGKKDRIALPRITKFCDNYNLPYSVRKVKNKDMILFTIMSKAFKNFIVSEFKIYDKNREKWIDVKKIITNNNKSNLEGLWEGLLLSDGSIRLDEGCVHTRYNFTNTSMNLVSLFNILTYIVKNVPLSRGYDYRSKHVAIKSTTCRRSFFVKDNYICSKIFTVSPTEQYKGYVYDLTIKNDPSFIVENSIVHNSASSFLTTALFGLSTVDRVQAKVPLLQERFLNADRIVESHSAPDYD